MSQPKFKNTPRDSNKAAVKKDLVSTSSVSKLEIEQQMFEHVYRKCNCGSGDVWSECNGINGDSSYCS